VNAQLTEVRRIAMDYLDYDTSHLHSVLHILSDNDGYGPRTDDAAKLAAIQDVIDTDEDRCGMAEIAAAIGYPLWDEVQANETEKTQT
jgi:hypothetical protein